MKIITTTAVAAIAAFAFGINSANACPDGQQAYYTSSGGPSPTAVEHCRKVYDHGGDVAWTGNLDKHLTPVLVDADSDPLTPDVPLVIDGKPIVTASGASNGDHQHDNPYVKGINGVAIGDGAHVGYWVPATEDTPGHYVYVDNGTALGANAKVTHEGSTAIGAGAQSTADHQVTLGTENETIKAPGIASQKSKDRQTQGKIEVVTSDQGGNLATDGGVIFDTLDNHSQTLSDHSAALASHQLQINRLNGKVNEAFEGVAIALAMESPQVDPGKRFGISLNWGNFEGENALAGAAKLRFNDTWAGTAGVGYGLGQNTLGVRAGVQAQW